MKANYTPGKWESDTDKPCLENKFLITAYSDTVIGRTLKIIAEVDYKFTRKVPGFIDLEEAKANAKLMAKSPEMHEQLKNLLFVFGAHAQTEMQRKAIEYTRQLLSEIKA